MEKEFVDGMRVNKPSEKAPEYIIANIGVNIGDFLAWANKHSDRGWVNIILKESKSGKFYVELDTYKRVQQNPTQGEVEYPPEESMPKHTGFNGNMCKDCTTTSQCNLCEIPF